MDDNEWTQDGQPIEPIPGQMCYDELLVPEEQQQEEQQADTSVADGQMDIWNLPQQEITQENLNPNVDKIPNNDFLQKKENFLPDEFDSEKLPDELDLKKEVKEIKEEFEQENTQQKHVQQDCIEQNEQDNTDEPDKSDQQDETQDYSVQEEVLKDDEMLDFQDNQDVQGYDLQQGDSQEQINQESLQENLFEEDMQEDLFKENLQEEQEEKNLFEKHEMNESFEEKSYEEEFTTNKHIEQIRKRKVESMDENFEEMKMNLDENIQNENIESKNASQNTTESENTTENSTQNENAEVFESEEISESQENSQKAEHKLAGGVGNSGNSVGGYYGGNGVLFKPLEEVLHDSMIPYTEHVVLDRALPRVEDGLKPVQRRILYSMLELGLTPDKPYRKSARIVGDCMGKYHPHGDSSVYDAMVRMSQDFVLRAPLVDGHGNFGSVDGDSAAAMRYTEARMTPLAMELLRDLEKDTVRWGLNFDDTLKEPDVLPGRFPNLLVNGTSGIAVGVATNIPPHNLGEVIDGVVAYINNPRIKLDEMMKIIKGPDFPTGGQLIFGSGLRQAYETGKGKITIRAKVGVEQVGDKESLVITEIPYQVNKAQLLQKIAELKEKEKDKLASISEIRDESDRNGMRAVIRLKKDANAKKVLGYLFKSTNLQMSYSINMVAIADGKPKQLGLMEIISYYSEFQREVVVRRTKFDLDAAKERAHIVEGLLVAIKNIDAVIKIIKTSANVSEAKTRLRQKFALSEKQAQAILDMRLARLVNLEVYKLQEELAALKQRIKELEEILGSKRLQFDVVKREILEIKRRFASARKSHEIKDESIKLDKIEDADDETSFLLALTAGKTIKKMTWKNYSKSQKTISEGSTVFDIHPQLLAVKPSDTVLIFTERGNCLKMQVDKMPECKLRDKGFTLKNLEKSIDVMEKPVKIMKVHGGGEVLFFTENGMVKRSTEKDTVVSKLFYQAVKINDGDKLINVQHDVHGKTILMLTAHGYCVNFEKSEVPLQGRVSAGVKGVNLEDGDKVIFAEQNLMSELAIVTDNGFVKKLSVDLISVSGRNRKGLKYISFNGGKEVLFVGSGNKFAVDLGVKFTILSTSKMKLSDRLNAGSKEIEKHFIGIYELQE